MTHEHDQAHAHPSPETSTARDDYEPGRASRTALMRKPDAAIMSGLVQRKARDANGVAEGADSAVAAASSSSGSALPDTLQRKFESSLGADLSGVRVHTGDSSAAANDAVGAKAYTMGNDIHFGAGHYDPSSKAGEHLLAHEVAHTVQQGGGGAQRMQFKLAVSSPADALEHEVFHSWWARGLKPASQNDGWIDEAWAVYHDGGAAQQTPFDFREPPVRLCPRTPWNRATLIDSYRKGSRFFAGVAALVGVDRLHALMREFYDLHAPGVITTAQLEAHLMDRTNDEVLHRAFARWIYGRRL